MSSTTDQTTTPSAAPGAAIDPDAPDAVDPEAVRAAIEYGYQQGWSDGLPLVPCTEAALAEMLATVDRRPDDVLLEMVHLNRGCSVRLAAINSVMAGCLPSYFPVVAAALEALASEGYAPTGLWQSTTGTAPCLLVNGPIRATIGLNSAGNVFGSGFRANATIGRAVRLIGLNAFGVRPHELDQATLGTPAKYTCCIAENEEQSPWAPFHHDHGFEPGDSAVTALTNRSVLHIEARHTTEPEQLLRDIAGSVARTGALVHATISACVVLSPEHAHLLAGAGWSKEAIRRFVAEAAVNDREVLASVGKASLSATTRWRLPDDHPDAIEDDAADQSAPVPAVSSADAVLVVVAGAANSGVSAVIETFGARGGPPAMAAIPRE